MGSNGPLNFMLSEGFFVGKFLSKNTITVTETYLFFGGGKRGKFSDSIEIMNTSSLLLEFAKIATCCLSSNFLTHDAAAWSAP